jgi:Ni/Fe-hydrogenase subunit HybB-like protein
MQPMTAVTTAPFATGYDNTIDDGVNKPVLVTGETTFHEVTRKICRPLESPRPPRTWYIAFAISVSLLGVLGAMIGYQVFTGVGVWGNESPSFWAFDIINFVFWVGIAHAGTLISAILLLFRQKWRTGINRFAEATTVFSVVCAGLYPAIHVGRPWLAYWLAPYPNTMRVWPNFFSPLLWDALAVATYTTVSVLFWYLGMVPDLATLRDRARSRITHTIYGIFALGWRGSARHWHIYERATLVIAAFATALVLGVSSTVSTDFAVSQIPGWHETIFPPYFTAGAVFSGFATILLLAIPARLLFGLKDFITQRHIDNLCKLALLMSSIMCYIYLIEFFIAYYSGGLYEQYVYMNRLFGPYWWLGWIMIFFNGVFPQVFWFSYARKTWWIIIPTVIMTLIGMWCERFSIIVTSIHRDFIPSSWHMYIPTWVDIATFAGTIGLFMTLFLLFCRFLPVVAMSEIKTILPQAEVHHKTAKH